MRTSFIGPWGWHPQHGAAMAEEGARAPPSPPPDPPLITVIAVLHMCNGNTNTIVCALKAVARELWIYYHKIAEYNFVSKYNLIYTFTGHDGTYMHSFDE